ncbi:MAG: D-lyxose/D-mannose family sugar isomerase [Candidatus Lokiarchaeota archaeon]|nr:D-lyxose/D-mannose family sugar isomerase [Candidatus Lokiarchaeota archaeon]
MERSQINKWIQEAKDFFNEFQWKLPPFAFWSLDKWQKIMQDVKLRAKHAMIIDNGLGWDVSDFGSNDFEHSGLLLFTMRNGNIGSNKDYAEKIMIQRDGQVTPFHYHWTKTEDIINRGGGNLMVEVYNAHPKDSPNPSTKWQNGKFAENPVIYTHDGIKDSVPAGTVIKLTPGESITIPPRLYHSFWGEKDEGWVLVGEVSKVNDDNTDNRFYRQLPRFNDIENDEKPVHVLLNEYDQVLDFDF